MENLTMCRVCLSDDVRMCLIANTHLQEMYESLTLLPLETKDSRPVQVCYICYAGLQNCYRLKKTCLQSEELLTQVLSIDALVSINIEEISRQRLRVVHPVVHLSMGDDVHKDTDNESKEDCDEIGSPDLNDDKDEEEEDDENEEKEENLEEHEIKIEVKEESSDYDPGDVQMDAITTEPDDVTIGTSVLKKRHIVTQKMSIEITSGKQNKNEPTETEVTEPERFENEIVLEKPVVISNIHKTIDKIVLLHNYGDDEVTANDEVQNQTSKVKKRLKTHSARSQRTRGGRKRFYCDLCEESYSYIHDLRSHMKYVHVGQKPKFTCELCKRYFTHRHHLKNHYCKYIEGDHFECDVCQKIFSRKSYLEKHIRIHYDRKTYSCNVCKKRYIDLNFYKKHICKHDKVKPYPCDVCGIRFENKNLLEKHTRRIHSEEKPFQCDVCGKCFILEEYLKSHIVLHNNDRPFACELCKKCFTTPRYLSIHRATHSNTRPYQCNICKRWYKQTQHLRLHKLTHLNVKPFQCNMCGKCFHKKTHLERHQNIHTGEESYYCDVCKKSFNQKANLKTHLRTHTLVKKKKSTLTKHIESQS